MKTLAGQTIEIQNHTYSSIVGTTDSSTTICQLGVNRNHSIVLQGPIGNLPAFTLISDGVRNKNLNIISAPKNTTDVTERILTVFSFDGRNEGVKECNGLGTCNNKTGKCECAYVRIDAFFFYLLLTYFIPYLIICHILFVLIIS